MTWLGPDGKILSSTDKTNVLENGDLIIRDLSWSDMGGYQCVVSNEDGEDQSTTFVYPIMVSAFSFILLKSITIDINGYFLFFSFSLQLLTISSARKVLVGRCLALYRTYGKEPNQLRKKRNTQLI